MTYTEDATDFNTSLRFMAMAASLVLCWIIFKVKMKKCEEAVEKTAALLRPLQRAATAVSTRQRVVKAATLVVEKTLAEYKSLITMLHEIPEEDFNREDFPALRQQLEEETVKAQVKMVKDCLAAASTEIFKALPTSDSKQKQDIVMTSLYEQGQLLMTISEEILAALDSRKRMRSEKVLRMTDQDEVAQLTSYDEYSVHSE